MEFFYAPGHGFAYGYQRDRISGDEDQRLDLTVRDQGRNIKAIQIRLPDASADGANANDGGPHAQGAQPADRVSGQSRQIVSVTIGQRIYPAFRSRRRRSEM
jgi:hypothetical protein